MSGKLTNAFHFFRDDRFLRDLRRFYVFVRPYRRRAVLAMLFTMAVGAAGAGGASRGGRPRR